VHPVTNRKRIIWPVGAGLAGSALLAGIYLGIVSWAESPKHAVELFWQDRWIVVPIILGFGIQVALYTILKKRLYNPGLSGPMNPALAPGTSVGVSGTTSTAAMLACCAHHVTDVLPMLGLTAAAAFLARYRLAFMLMGLGTNLAGIGFMLFIMFRERRRSMLLATIPSISKEIV